MEKLLDELSFDATSTSDKTVKIDAAYVNAQLAEAASSRSGALRAVRPGAAQAVPQPSRRDRSRRAFSACEFCLIALLAKGRPQAGLAPLNY